MVPERVLGVANKSVATAWHGTHPLNIDYFLLLYCTFIPFDRPLYGVNCTAILQTPIKIYPHAPIMYIHRKGDYSEN